MEGDMPRLPAPLPHPPKRAAAHYGPARDSVSQPSHIHSMEEGKEGRPIREEEARYLVIQIANQNPKLDGLLIAARLQSVPWAEILKMLQEATPPN